MSWWSRKIHFHVTLRLNGKHPYIAGRRDYEDRDVTVSVHARSWNAAEMAALRCCDEDYWSTRVISIAKANAAPFRTEPAEASVTTARRPNQEQPDA